MLTQKRQIKGKKANSTQCDQRNEMNNDIKNNTFAVKATIDCKQQNDLKHAKTWFLKLMALKLKGRVTISEKNESLH